MYYGPADCGAFAPVLGAPADGFAFEQPIAPMPMPWLQDSSAQPFLEQGYYATNDVWQAYHCNLLHDAYSQVINYDAKIGYDYDQTGILAAHQANELPEEPREIVLVTSLSSGACDTLCADAASADIVAFDAEWAPDRTWGSDNPISVLQLAFPQSRRVYVIQLRRLNGKLPQAVSMMLVNPEVTKVGFAVDQGDIAKFARSDIALTKASVVDVQELSWKSLGMTTAYGCLGLKDAAVGILGFMMNKDKRLACSDWASQELRPEQVRYAGLDAWVTLRLYCSQHRVG